MKIVKGKVVIVATLCFLITPLAFAEGDESKDVKSGKTELQSLNQEISNLSSQIVDRQKGLESDLEKLMAQRRALLDLENRVMEMISNQEEKLISQRLAIQEAEKQLDSQKAKYLEQHRRLDELRASLKTDEGRGGQSMASAE